MSDAEATSGKANVKQKIINSTLKLIAKKNSMLLTVREIIKEAKVNIAAINYYFGSKNGLMQEIEKRFFREITAINHEFFRNPSPEKDSLYKWSLKILTYLVENPAMINFIKKFIIMDSSKQIPQCEDIPILLGSLEQYFIQILPDMDKKPRRFKIIQFFSGLILPLTFSFENLQEFYSYDVRKKTDRIQYVNSLLSTILH
jgi:AcrR family transcriptional regulator